MLKTDLLVKFTDFNGEIISYIEKLNQRQRNKLKEQLAQEIEEMNGANITDLHCIYFCKSVIEICNELHNYPTLKELKSTKTKLTTLF